MKTFPVVADKDLRQFVVSANTYIQKMRSQDFGPQDRDAANVLLKNLAAAKLIELDGNDFDISDEQLRNAVLNQKIPQQLAEQIRGAVREVFYQFYYSMLKLPGASPESTDRSTKIMHGLKSVAEWACVNIGYQLMYADGGAQVSDAEDVFRAMLHRSPAAAFFCAEIHSSGLLKSEQTGERMFDFDEALQLYAKNLRPEVATQNASFYVRSAIRYAEIVLKHDLGEDKLDFITDVLVKSKPMIFQVRSRVSHVDQASFLQAMSNVFNRQIYTVSGSVLENSINAGLVDTQSADLLKKQLHTYGSHYVGVVSSIAAK